MNATNQTTLHLALPKGRMQQGILALLSESGINVRLSKRGYRPTVSLPNVETKILKPQNIVEMLQLGSRDVGFAGADWVQELKATGPDGIVEILDTGLDPVQVVAAAPSNLLENAKLPQRKLRVATEYQTMAKSWLEEQNIDADIVRAYGATEVFPPEDADFIVDNTATGATLRDNDLQIIGQLMTSSTRMYASRQAMDNPQKRERIEALKLLANAVLAGRRRVMLEVNVAAEQLEAVTSALPAMQKPTVASLFGDAGYAVRAAVLREELPSLIPKIKTCGGRDIVVSNLDQIVP